MVRQRVAAVGRIEADATGLLHVRRIREALDDDALLAAAHIALGWSRVERALGIPEPFAVEIVALCDRLYARYRLGRPRRLLEQLRANHDAQVLREAEANLIGRHLDDLGSTAELEPIELCVVGVGLAPNDELRRQLRARVAASLAAIRGP